MVSETSPEKRTRNGPKGLKSAKAKTCILVLGAHRSGTSMLTGLISRLGCDMAANLMPANFANRKGYYEPQLIAELNDKILASAGSTWQDWQPITPGWFESSITVDFHNQATNLLQQEFGSSHFFAIKDPRICRLLPFWQEVFASNGITPLALHLHRNPVEVANSLRRRDHTSLEFGYLLWLRNVLEAEFGTRGLPRHFTSYSRVMNNWAHSTDDAAKALGIRWPRMSTSVTKDIQDFVDSDLQNFTAAPENVTNNRTLPVWVRDCFAIMERWAAEGEDERDFDRLDEIKQQMNDSAIAFSALIDDSLAASKSLSEAAQRTDQLQEEVTQQKSQAQHWRQQAATLVTAQEELRLEQNTTAHQLNQIITLKTDLTKAKAVAEDNLRTLQTNQAVLVKQIREELSTSKRKNTLLSQKISIVTAEKAALYSSTSWRMTSPLRKLKTFLKP